MLENKRAVLAIEVLVEPQPWLSTREGALKQRLPLDQRLAPHVGPVELDQVECPHENAVVSIPSPDQLKTGDSVIATGNGFTIDDAGPGAQPRQSFDDQGEALGQIVTRPAVKPHTTSILPCDDPEAVMLDFVQPRLAGRWVRAGCGEARRDEARRQDTR